MDAVRLLRSGRAYLAPQRYSTSPLPGVHWLALGGMIAVAVMTFASRDITRIGEILTFALALFSVKHIYRTDRHWWLFAVFIAYAAWILLIDFTVSIAPDHVNVAKYERNYLRQYFFLFSGWWLGANLRNVNVLFVAALAGCALELAVLSSPEDWIRAIEGQRSDFGFHNAQHTALYFGTCLLMLLHLLSEALRLPRPSARIAATAALAGAAALCLFILAATQTRQTWVGLAAAAVCAAALIGLCRPAASVHWSRKRLVTTGAVMLAVVAALVLMNPFEGAWERTQSEWNTVTKLLEGETPERYRSITIRLIQWRTAGEYIAARPLTGYGGGANSTLTAMSAMPEQLQAGFGHFHNSYLESALHYGLVGTALWLTGLVVLFARAWRAVRDGRLGALTGVFAVGWVAYFAAVNFFETFINYDSSYYVAFVAGGAIYALTMERPRRSGGGAPLNQRRPAQEHD